MGKKTGRAGEHPALGPHRGGVPLGQLCCVAWEHWWGGGGGRVLVIYWQFTGSNHGSPQTLKEVGVPGYGHFTEEDTEAQRS